ncbi:MAG TPA: SRPBCC family protein [Verrucomicrobiae bacterium]|nr:SRPBCC family protein [Verrucomicrobiae bacterium]
MNSKLLAQSLGWFSIGLGLAELIAPRRVEKCVGAPGSYKILTPMLGVREITAGLGILTQDKPKEWLWSRVIGDVMDLALLGAAFGSKKSDTKRLAIATTMVAGVTALDILASKQTSQERVSMRNGRTKDGSVRMTRTITIQRSARELYSFWRNFENLPKFMPHLKSVRVIDEKKSHWISKGPAGKEIEWDAEITSENLNDHISWQSLPGSEVPNKGTVRFEELPGDRGCVVRVSIVYDPPGGVLGSKIAKLLGRSPEQMTGSDLRRFKQLLETGEVATTAGQPAGRVTSQSRRFDKVLPQLAES